MKHEQEFSPWCPLRVVEYAASKFGGQAWNLQSRTRITLERECAFAIGVWVKKFGTLNEQQADYAWKLFEWAIRDAASTAPTDWHRFPYFSFNVRRMVNDERVDEGMKRRGRRQISSPVSTDGLMVAA